MISEFTGHGTIRLTSPQLILPHLFDCLSTRAHAGLAADGALLGVGAVAPAAVSAAAAAPSAPTGAHAQQEGGGVAALCVADTATGKSVAHAVAAARLDVRAQFGEAAVLFRCAGERGLDIEQVPVDASGRTVHPLQHGAFYYVLV